MVVRVTAVAPEVPDEEDELVPAVALDVVGLLDVDAGGLGGVDEGRELGVRLAVMGAADDLLELARLLDDAGLVDDGDDIGDAGDGALGADDGRDALVAVDAVLQGDDAGVGAEQRLHLLGGLFGVPQLDREQHHVDRADLGRIVGGVDLGEMQVAVMRAVDRQAVLLDGCEMGAARDVEHLVSGRLHARAEIGADRTRRHGRNSHIALPLEPLARGYSALARKNEPGQGPGSKSGGR